ncbi:MAG TPA: ATP-binding protein [Polyangiaceae bacterium]|nr:ATP-binding protein [Polyangiaceae bacterium]
MLTSSDYEARAPLADCRVLLIDSHVEFAVKLAEALSDVGRGLGAVCYRAPTNSDALVYLEDEVLDLVLVDLPASEATSLELLDLVRKHQPMTQVLCLSTEATLAVATKSVEAGAFGYLQKPFREQVLLASALQAISVTRLLRQQAELRAKLELSEHRCRELIDGLPTLVMALDEQGAIVHWNRQLESATGFSAAEVLGKDGRAWIQDDGVQRLPIKTGGQRIVRWKSASVGDGSAAGLRYAIGVDVTDETEMQRRAARAERLAAVGTLAAGLAHEVRNPLNSATLQLQLIERRLDKGNVDRAAISDVLGIVKTEIQRLDRLVTDFLEFARPTPIQAAATDLAALANELLDSLSQEASRARVVVVRSFGPDLGQVVLDAKRIRQVLLNLVKNALEAMATEGGTLTVRLGRSPEAGGVLLEVEDSGPGFGEDVPIFDAFFTTKDHGTGLGLSIVHRIVSEHGGTIGCVSKPGSTRFSITLPELSTSVVYA